MEIVLLLAIVAVVALALTALNFGLQRLARPDKGGERIAGCCGMALPEEMLGSGAETLLRTALEEYAETESDKQNEVYHEL
ncbi:MAG: hypothetical protein ABI670_21615 [Chloroflexota bacterium]